MEGAEGAERALQLAGEWVRATLVRVNTAARGFIVGGEEGGGGGGGGGVDGKGFGQVVKQVDVAGSVCLPAGSSSMNNHNDPPNRDEQQQQQQQQGAGSGSVTSDRVPACLGGEVDAILATFETLTETLRRMIPNEAEYHALLVASNLIDSADAGDSSKDGRDRSVSWEGSSEPLHSMDEESFRALSSAFSSSQLLGRSETVTAGEGGARAATELGGGGGGGGVGASAVTTVTDASMRATIPSSSPARVSPARKSASFSSTRRGASFGATMHPVIGSPPDGVGSRNLVGKSASSEEDITVQRPASWSGRRSEPVEIGRAITAGASDDSSDGSGSKEDEEEGGIDASLHRSVLSDGASLHRSVDNRHSVYSATMPHRLVRAIKGAAPHAEGKQTSLPANVIKTAC